MAAEPLAESPLRFLPWQERVLGLPEEYDLLLSGGRAGGKSRCLVLLILRHLEMHGSKARCLVIRETHRALEDLVSMCREVFGKVYGTAARFNAAEGFVRVPGEPDVAEPAVTIVDEYQGLGLGTALLARLVAAARERGVQRFRCLFLAENRQIRALLDDYADQATQHRDREMLTMEFPIPEPRPQERIRDLVRAGPMQRALRDAATGSMSLRPDDHDDQP